MRKPKENDQYVKAVEYSHTLEKFLIMERENCAALLDKLEAAERERDELRLEIARIGGAKAIDVLRRDAAAREEVGKFVKCGDTWYETDATDGIPLYTAAPTAVLRDIEPLIEGALKLHGLLTAVDGHSQLSDGFRNGARWAAKELCAQQQKVVELYKRKSMEVISGQRYSYVLLEDLLPELDAANVKWEVKK